MLKYCVPLPIRAENFSGNVFLCFNESFINPDGYGEILVNIQDVFGGMLAVNVLEIMGDLARVSYSSHDLYSGANKNIVWTVPTNAIKKIEIPGG